MIIYIFHRTQESPHWCLPNRSGELILQRWVELILQRWVKTKAVVNLVAFFVGE